MSDEASKVERYTGIAAGAALLLLAMSMFGWGVRLVVAGVTSEAGWPPGLGQLLFPIALTSALVGLGSWRLLLLGLPERIRGYSLGRLILAGFGAAALTGALI
jgi:hypothetical protein